MTVVTGQNVQTLLLQNRDRLTRQQYLTLKGLAKAGDIIGAMKGLQTILRRDLNERKKNDDDS